MVQWNIQGKNNLPKIRNYVKTIKIYPDNICLEKTWANQRNTLPNIPSYAKTIYKNRTEKKCGGVAIYVKNNIAFEEIDLSTVNVKLEVCAIKLHLEKKTVSLYNIYDSHFWKSR